VLPLGSLSLPPRPAEQPPAQFPVIAAVAPLAAAVLIWVLTGTPLALVFGALGPVIAAATMLDGRRVNRRTARRERADWLRARDSICAVVNECHAELRAAAWRRTPSAALILSAHADDSRWRSGNEAMVALGTGSTQSGLALDTGPAGNDDVQLRRWAATLTDAPVVADVASGLSIVGPPLLARAAARGFVMQLAHAWSPDRASVTSVPVEGWEWTSALPHRGSAGSECEITIGTAAVQQGAVNFLPASHHRRLAISLTADDVSAGCATVIRLTGPATAEVIRSPVHPPGHEFRPELVTEADADRFAQRLTAAGRLAGITQRHRRMPDTVDFAQLHTPAAQRPIPADAAPAGRLSLSCPVGLGDDGVIEMDLVRDGPHAIVGGTTGSGKSELLVTWVVSMAAAHPPADVNFLLVDFKGGAAFRPLLPLPHCVGLLTDLAEPEAARALASLRAELRHREQTLNDIGARDISDPGLSGRLPRLVIVVDEFQAMLDSFPALHSLFVDLAARGRSLGIHLILCTQRPAGAVRDALLANCSLRVSLRVNNRADSQAVIGDDAAASIARSQPGRCLIQTGADGTRLCQVATTTAGDIRAVLDGNAGRPIPRRPWLDPLPFVVPGSMVSAADTDALPGYLLGLVDEPQLQRYRVARYNPPTDGSLLVLGAAGSGKSTLLSAIATWAGAPPGDTARVVPSDIETAWDALATARERADSWAADSDRTRELSTILLCDDFDAVYGRWQPDYQLAALDSLRTLLRDGPAAGMRLVIAVERLDGQLRSLLPLFPSSLMLRVSDREDYRSAGGPDALFDPALPPGRGVWRAARIQLTVPAAASRPPADGRVGAETTQAIDPVDRPLVVVTGSPVRSEGILRSRLGGSAALVSLASEATRGTGAARLDVGDPAAPTVFVGDPDAWQANWPLLAALRRRADILFDRCSVADFRLISGRRELPPPLAPGRDHVWLLTPDGQVGRAALPPVRRNPGAEPLG
jgi:S-DNA-T family DNA segregation ATPase FtsK/SpoIIIE